MFFSLVKWTIIFFFSFFIGFAICLLGVIDKTGDLPHRLASLWGWLVCKISRVKIEITGVENLIEEKAQILVSNHQGFFDIFAFFSCLPVQFRWIAKESLFELPFVGWGMKACNYISVDRSDKKKALKSFIDASKTLKTGKSIIIFPEGTRAIGDEIGNFKKGALLLARRNKLPVVPVTIKGSSKIMERGSIKINPGTISITIDKSIDTKYLIKNDEEKYMTKIRKIFET